MNNQLTKIVRMAISFGVAQVFMKQRFTPEEFDVPFRPVPYGSRVARPIPKRVSGKRAWKMRGKRPS